MNGFSLRYWREGPILPEPGMVRQMRIQYQGAIYHLMNQGDRRGKFFGTIRCEAVTGLGNELVFGRTF